MLGLPIFPIQTAFTVATGDATIRQLSLYFHWTKNYILNYCFCLRKFGAFVVRIIYCYTTIQRENPVNHRHSRMLAIFARKKFFSHSESLHKES